jgi:S-adenosylmethionine-diacylglycerol 3-amino-3-carboxypropyl transferase
MKPQLSKVRHDYIRYANCWEDADILLEGLNPLPNKRFLSIGSAGDNSFSLLTCDPELVVAVDINLPQLRLIELKKAVFQSLDYSDFLKLLGFKKSKNRLDIFEKIKHNLNYQTVGYWEQHAHQIEEGIIYTGKFEKYFRLFSKKLLPLIHKKKRIAGFFEEKTAEKQIEYYNEKWNNKRWRGFFKLFFSKFVMGRLGRDPQFLKQVEVPVSNIFLKKRQRI